MKSISFSITRQGADILLIPAKHTRTLIFLHGLGDSAEGKPIFLLFFSALIGLFYFLIFFMIFFRMQAFIYFFMLFRLVAYFIIPKDKWH